MTTTRQWHPYHLKPRPIYLPNRSKHSIPQTSNSNTSKSSFVTVSSLFPVKRSKSLIIGERTPVRQRLQNAGIPPFWNVCRTADQFRATVLLPDNSFPVLQYHRLVESPDSKGRLIEPGKNGERYWYRHFPLSQYTGTMSRKY